jgi:hypothetical protein
MWGNEIAKYLFDSAAAIRADWLKVHSDTSWAFTTINADPVERRHFFATARFAPAALSAASARI